ncbi:MAG: hypothetical protein ACT4QE_11785 [Anaerolineales bacterium]
MVNHYYFYGVDGDCGPFFITVSSHFPYTAKFCLNGHAYLQRQLSQAGIAYAGLDNGLRSCGDPARMQALADGLSAETIEALVRQWRARLPQPCTAIERAAGYDYAISSRQAEFALTQVLDRPLTGRLFFEAAIRENLDLGRPEPVQLIVERRITKATPSRFRTRIITDGVTPALHVDYRHTRIKQDHKEGRALRTETTLNDTRDFYLGKRLTHLPALRQIGFQAHRRPLHVQILSHDCLLAEDAFQQVNQPVKVHNQRAAALRFTDPRVQAWLSALVAFRLLPRGFANPDLRLLLAPLLGLTPDQVTAGQMTCHLRRLRLHGLIER